MSYKQAKRRHIKEDIHIPPAVGIIKNYVKPYHYLHFSETVNPWANRNQDKKLIWGLYLQSHYDTPVGIYGFPIIEKTVEDFINGTRKIIRFKADSPGVIIFKARNPETVLDVGKYNEGDLERDVEKIKNILVPYVLGTQQKRKKEIEEAEIRLQKIQEEKAGFAERYRSFEEKDDKEGMSQASLELVKANQSEYKLQNELHQLKQKYLGDDTSKVPNQINKIVDKLYNKSEGSRNVATVASQLFYIVRFVHNSVGKLGLNIENKFLFRRILTSLGYSGVHDPGTGTIHTNEPYQGAYFGTNAIDVIDIIKNPYREKPKWEGINPKTKKPVYKVENELKELLTESTGPIDLGKYKKTKKEHLIHLITEEATPAERLFIAKRLLSRDLGLLVDDPSEKVRLEVAQRADMDIIETMYNDSSISVLAELIKRYDGDLFYRVLKRHIRDYPVVIAAAQNPHINESYRNTLLEQSKKIISQSVPEEVWTAARTYNLIPFREFLNANANENTILAYMEALYNKTNINEENYSSEVFLSDVVRKYPHQLAKFMKSTRVRKEAVKVLAANGDVAVLAGMLNDPNPSVRAELASVAPPEICVKLLNDPSVSVVLTALVYVPEDKVVPFKDHPDEDVRRIVAKRIDAKYLKEMYLNGTDKIKAAIALRSDIDSEILKLILHDDSLSEGYLYIKGEALSHASEEELHQISTDENMNVDTRIYALKTLTNVYGYNEETVDILVKLSTSPITKIRMWIAQNVPAQTQELKEKLTTLKNDPDDDVVVAYIDNHRYEEYSEEYLNKILDRKNGDIDLAVTQVIYSKIPWVRLLESTNDNARYAAIKQVDKKYLPKFIHDEFEPIRVQIANTIDEKYLPEMMKDPSVGVRNIVAQKIPRDRLILMVKDQSETVRDSVAQRIPYNQISLMMKTEKNPRVLEVLRERMRRVEHLSSDDPSNQYYAATSMNYQDLQDHIDLLKNTTPNAQQAAINRLPILEAFHFVRSEDENVRLSAYSKLVYDKNIAKKYHKVLKSFMMHDNNFRVQQLFVQQVADESDLEAMVKSDNLDTVSAALHKMKDTSNVFEELLNRQDLGPIEYMAMGQLFMKTKPELLEKYLPQILTKNIKNLDALGKLAQRLPEKSLHLLIDSPIWDTQLVRYAVAQRVDKKYLTLLMDDPSVDVRGAVAKRIDYQYLRKMLGNEILNHKAQYSVLNIIKDKMVGNEYAKLYAKFRAVRMRIKPEAICPHCECDCEDCTCETEECPNCGCGFDNCENCGCHCEDCNCDEEQCEECGCGLDPCPNCGCHCPDCTCETEQCPDCGCGYDNCENCGCHCEDCTCETEECPNCGCGFDDCLNCGCHCEDCPCETEHCEECGCGEDEDEEDTNDTKDPLVKLISKKDKKERIKIATKLDNNNLKEMLKKETDTTIKAFIRHNLLKQSLAFSKRALPLELGRVRSLHDPEFREAAGKHKVIVYHGTSSKKLALIVQHGSLDPSIAENYVNWESVSPGIYVTRQLEGFTGAWLYANHTAKEDGGDPVVLEMAIPLNWIEIDPDDTRHNEKGEMNDLGENQGVVHRPINIKNIKGIQLQGKEIGQINPAEMSGLFEQDKTKWMPIGTALRLIAKNVYQLPEEYKEMVANIPKGMARNIAYQERENEFAEAMEIFFSTYILNPDARFNGKNIEEIALVWFLKNKNALWGNAKKELENFGKIIGVDMEEKLEYLGDYAPKPNENLAQYLRRVRNG